MDRINKNNYEVYFLDYHEGRLNSDEKQKVKAFLQEYPEFYNEFEDYGNVVLPVPEIRYPNKSELFKTELSIPEANDWEFQCIAFMEGDLTEDDLRDFDKLRNSDPEKAKILELYLATKSLPNESITFEDKAALKKKIVLIPKWIYGAVSAAAILVLGWIIFSPFSGDVSEQQFAGDSLRQIIYIDKISHPGKYEKVASVESGATSLNKTSLPSSSEKISSDENLLSNSKQMIREDYTMASLEARKPIKLTSIVDQSTTSTSYLAYRYIPSAEDEEYKTLVAFSGDFIRKQLLGQDPEIVNKSKFTFWELADASLEKVSNVFGTGADIEREYSESGELLAVSFESNLVGFNKPVRRRLGAQSD